MLPQSSLLLSVAMWVAASSLKGAVLITAVTILRHLLTTATTSAWRHALWLPVLVCLLCPLGPSVPLASALRSSVPARPAAPLTAPAAIPHTGLTALTGGSLDSRSNGQTVPVRLQSWSPDSTAPAPAASARDTLSAALLSWAMLIWATGAGLLGLLYLGNLWKFRQVRLAASAVAGNTCTIFERCKTELHVRRKVRLLESRNIASPTVVGWRSPALLLPHGLHTRLDTAQLRHVILHELAHVKRHDVLVNWIAAIAQLLHWFNPAVWLAARLMRADMESASDAYVLGHLSRGERTQYGAMLVDLADSNRGSIPPPYGLGIADRHEDLKDRLLRIARFRPASMRLKLAGALAVAALMCTALIQPTFSASSEAGIRVSLNAPPAVAVSPSAGVPMQELIEQVAANIHKRVIVDPKTASRVILYGQKLDQITYADFLTILRINGFTAIEVNDYVNVVPIANVRSLPLPTFSGGTRLPDDQFATMSVMLRNTCAASLIPILRPILPQYAFLAADVGSNTVLAVDTAANLRRVRSIISQLDASTRQGYSCVSRRPRRAKSQPSSTNQIAPAVPDFNGGPVAANSGGGPTVSGPRPNMNCGRTYSASWDNCVGSLTYPNGNIYLGEYHHGMREGFGVLFINAKGISDSNDVLSNEPSIYVGEFRGDRLNGQGVWFTKSGAGYSGTFADNIPQSDVAQRNCSGTSPAAWDHCVATVSYGNGNIYRGEFILGHRDGIGMLDIRATGSSDDRDIRMPTRSVYAGEFKGDRLNGPGMIFAPGAGFYGTFANNLLAVPARE